MIRMIITDCDGVLTDGKLYYGASGEELKVFNVKDGTAIKELMAQGMLFGVVSGRESQALWVRSKELGFHFCHMGVANKQECMAALRERHGLSKEEVLYIGDDVNDLSAREECGTLYAVNDAAEALKAKADVVLETKGGSAVFKEVLKRINGHQ